MAKFCLDSNVIIDALRVPALLAELKRFLDWALPATYLSAVVLQELEAGVADAQARALAEVIEPFDRRKRLFAPSIDAWREAGRALNRLRRAAAFPPAGPPRSLVNDLLLALSCREAGIILITQDVDFRRLLRYVRGLRLAAPYPAAPRNG